MPGLWSLIVNNWTTGPLTLTRRPTGSASQQAAARAILQEAFAHQGFGASGLGLPKELFQRYKTACQCLGYRATL
jgi:hypothetical protein